MNRVRGLGTAVLAVVGLMFMPAGPAAQATDNSEDSSAQAAYLEFNGKYNLRNMNSNKCLGVSGGNPNNGAVAVQWTCQYLVGSDQEMYIYPVARIAGVTWHMINPEHSVGKCLGVSAASGTQGISLLQWTCDLQAGEQLFAFRGTGLDGNPVQVVAQHSGQCMSVSEASRENGGRVIQWPCSGGHEQIWYY